MHAEFEQTVKSLVQEKCLSVKDESIREFLGSCLGNIKLSPDDITGLLKRFGPAHRETFRHKQKDDQAAECFLFFDNIVTNRHKVAHSEGSNATFREVKRFYEEGHVVLDYFREALIGMNGNDAGI